MASQSAWWKDLEKLSQEGALFVGNLPLLCRLLRSYCAAQFNYSLMMRFSWRRRATFAGLFERLYITWKAQVSATAPLMHTWRS